MVATVRCEEIAAQCVAALASSAAAAALAAAAAEGPVAGLAGKLAALSGAQMAAYDDEAKYFEAGVREAKRGDLAARLAAALRPVAAAHLAHVSSALLTVWRCKLDPSLKATRFQPLNLRVHTVLST